MKRFAACALVLGLLATGVASAMQRWECTNCTLYPDGRVVCEHCTMTDG